MEGQAVRHVWVALVAALVLAGCGEDRATDPERAAPSASDTPSESAAADVDAPACDAVWVDGSELPRSYTGCTADGVLVPRDGLGCSSGQRIVRYDDHFYAVPGGTIHQTKSSLEDDVRYRDAIASCRG